MLGWAIGFFIAAVVAAVFGFGGLASTFTGIAVLLFWVFLALFVLSVIAGLFRGGAHAAGGHSGTRFGAVGLVALVVGVGVLVYAWMDNDMSAERAGRVIDREVAQLADTTSEALGEAGDRASTMVETASYEVRRDAAEGLNEASDNVDPQTPARSE
ncbi:MAG: DUF1328 domain-containing protein [Hyphomonadaceae bacterium]|nr:DUF1328 domain-containing protein [Hyphomonadaceae bacterium]MBX3510538.1 DUF1328 domain-containing protein [Hyphomonadaceae bacterium]